MHLRSKIAIFAVDYAGMADAVPEEMITKKHTTR